MAMPQHADPLVKDNTAVTFPKAMSSNGFTTLHTGMIAANKTRWTSLALTVFATFLYPLPYLLGSMANRSIKTDAAAQVSASASKLPEQSYPKAHGYVMVFGWTSATLFSIVLLDALVHHRGLSKSKHETVKSSSLSKRDIKLSGNTLRRILLRLLAVVLPYLAMLELGGARTGIIVMLTFSKDTISFAGRESARSGWRAAVISMKWSFFAMGASLMLDIAVFAPEREVASLVRGYLALAKSILFLPPPYSTTDPASSRLSASPSQPSPSFRSGSPSLGRSPATDTLSDVAISPLISSHHDRLLTLIAGCLAATLAVFVGTFSSSAFPWNINFLTYSILSVFTMMLALHAPHARKKYELDKLLSWDVFVSVSIIGVFALTVEYISPLAKLAFMVSAILALVAAQWDAQLLRAVRGYQTSTHNHNYDTHVSPRNTASSSRITQILLQLSAGYPLIHGILLEKESRRILYFMSINLAFMFVQTFYALASGSLGLLSDSIHMFFDCVGLLAGLIAAIMSKWPPNSRFPYGYGKVETLSGLGNGIFLMLISVEIIWESTERFVEGVQLKHLNELLLVSVGGLVVNLIGLLFIGHAHHGHSHDHTHGHDHDHSHAHSNENMLGIYLHILADTMGSVAVIISTILTTYTGWSGWDPLASAIIAVLIIAASCPLVTSSARTLLLTVPSETEYLLRNTLQEINDIKGVIGYAVPRFWLDDSEQVQDKHDHCHVHDHGEEHGHNHDQMHHNSHTLSSSDPDRHRIHEDHLHSENQQDHKHEHQHEHEHDHDHDHDHVLSAIFSTTHTHSHEHDNRPREHNNHDHQHDHKLHGEHEAVPKPRLIGVIHVIAARGADLDDVRSRVESFLRDRSMSVVVHVEKEGIGRCWCGSGMVRHGKSSSVVAM